MIEEMERVCKTRGILNASIDCKRLIQKERKYFSKLYLGQLEAFKVEILESLRYAQRLQYALMQEKRDLKELFSESFILNSPKNIVSGDFYWFKQTGERALIATGDCTGHGVPGALLTIMSLNILHAGYGIFGHSSPAALMNFLDTDLNLKLSHRSTGKVLSDGVDISFCEIDRAEKMLAISGTNSTVYLVRKGEIQQFKTDKYATGNAEAGKKFGSQLIPLVEEDMIYMFSDGIIDQFGGPNDKKFGSQRFRDLLSSISKKNAEEQHAILQTAFNSWQGKQEQTDDVLVMGVRF